MIISFKHQFIFVAIPKTATHSFRVALRPHLAANDWEQCVLFEKKYFPVEALKQIGHGHLSLGQAKPFILPQLWQDYFKFCTVRNPFSRFVSYCKFVNRENSKMKADALGTMKKIIADKKIQSEILFRPQFEFVVDENEKLAVDYVCRFEHLQDDFDRVCQKLNFPKVQLQKINATDSAEFLNFYDDELRGMVREFYRKDFEIFDY